jgi:hypothetical protein
MELLLTSVEYDLKGTLSTTLCMVLLIYIVGFYEDTKKERDAMYALIGRIGGIQGGWKSFGAFS